MKKITLLFLVAHLVPVLLFAQAKTGAERVLEMGRGINLGNVLSAPTEGDWAIQSYKSSNFLIGIYLVLGV